MSSQRTCLGSILSWAENSDNQKHTGNQLTVDKQPIQAGRTAAIQPGPAGSV